LDVAKIITKDLKDNETKNYSSLQACRWSLHGMRAKDKTFNATLQTDFDTSIGKINVVPQDIGSALLNLLNNGLYAIGVKCKVEVEGHVPTATAAPKSRMAK
jgi:nitrogen-specific signal transduction histidine kinase